MRWKYRKQRVFKSELDGKSLNLGHIMAGLSENKLLRNENKHKEKIKKQIKLFPNKITEFTDENVLLVGDSKVRHLYDVMSDHTHLRMVWRSGAELENNQLTPQVPLQIFYS